MTTPSNKLYLRMVLRMGLFTALLMMIMLLPALFIEPAGAQEGRMSGRLAVLESPLKLFQATISKADGQRCPMYPSCSHYAEQAIQRHGKIKGWLLSADRLLRCGRDETRLTPEVIVQGKRHAYDPLEANTFWWSRP